MERHKINFLYWAIAIVALAIFVHNAWRYVEIRYAEDDAFVSMVYARRLLEGHGLTWTDGVRVEGYSNFLWTMAQAGLGAFGVDLFVSSRILGFLGMGLVFLSSIVVFHPTRSKSIFVSSFVLFALALSQPFAIWTCGGLEVSFVVGFLSIALAIVLPTLEHGLTNRRMWLAGIPFGLLCLTRPDGPLFIAATAGALTALNKFDCRAIAKIFILCLFSCLCYLGLLGFRLWYYGEWVPNTALVKLPMGTWTQISMGLEYLEDLRSQRAVLFFAALAIPAALFDRGQRKTVFLIASVALIWTCYVVYIGGDNTFRGLRQLLPTLLLLIWLAGIGLGWLWQRLFRYSPIWKIFAAALIVLSLIALPMDQLRDENKSVISAYYDNHQWTLVGENLSEGLVEAFGNGSRDPYIAIASVGVVPYFTGWPTLHTLGLTDKWLPRHPPEHPVWTKMLGHQLGNGKYVLSKKPDLISMAGGRYGCYFGGLQTDVELRQDPGFFVQYRFVQYDRPGKIGRIKIWVRFESDLLGIKHSQERVEIPVYLLDGQGTGVLVLQDKEFSLPMPAGSWALARRARVPSDWRTAVTYRGNTAPPVTILENGDVQVGPVIDEVFLTSLVATRS